MTKLAEQILEQAKALSDDERIEVAEELMHGWKVSEDPVYQAEWEAEIERRIDDLESGRTKAIPADVALRMIRNGGKDVDKTG